MAGMHFHLNSEDQALLKVVEHAVAGKGQEQDAVVRDGSVEEMCFVLAGAAPTADVGFRDDLLARLQSAMATGEVETDFHDESPALIRGEVVERSSPAVQPIQWGENGRVERRVSRVYKESSSASSSGWLKKVWVTAAGVAAVLVFGIALVALFESQAMHMAAPVSFNDGLMSETPTAPTATASFVGFLNVTPVAAAAVVQKMQKIYSIAGQTSGRPLWSPDGKQLATSSGGQMSVWNMETGTRAYSNSMEAGRFGMAMAWSPDGSRLAATVGDRVELYSTGSGVLEHILSAPGMTPVATPYAEDRSSMVTTLPEPSLSWSPDGRYVASTYNEDFPSFGEMMGGMGLLDPSLSQEERVVGSSVHVWNASTGELAYTLALSKAEMVEIINLTAANGGGGIDPLMKVGWSPNGKYLATLYFNRTIVVWDVASRTRIRTLYDTANFWESHGIGLTEFQWLPDGHTIAQYQRDFVQIWDVETGAVRSLPDISPSQGIPPAEFTVDPAVPHTPVPTYAYRDEGYSALESAEFTQQGDKLITIDGQFRLWDVAAGKQIFKQPVTNGRSNFLLRWAPDGKVALYSGLWQELQFWSTESRSDIRVLSAPLEEYFDAAWSPDGSRLVLITDKGIEVWGDPADFPLYVTPTATPLAKAVCGTWAMANAPPVGNASGLADVVVIGSSDVWAVGYARPTIEPNSGANQPGDASSLAMHWDGAEWTRVPVPRVDGGSNQLNGVAGVAADDVWAVGTSGDFEGAYIGYSGARKVGAFVAHWDGKAWTQAKLPDDLQSASAWLVAVGALAKDDVWAVGYSGGDIVSITPTPLDLGGTGDSTAVLHSTSLILHWNGAEWSRVDVPSGGTTISTLTALSVVSKDEVWATGNRYSAPQTEIGLPHIGVPSTEPWAIRWDGTTWKEASIPAVGNMSEGISVVDGAGWIASDMATEGSNEIRMARWDGQSWGEYTMPTPTRDPMMAPPSDGVSDVLTLGSGDAWAVGFQSPRGAGSSSGTLAMHWDGWQWSAMTTPNLGVGDEYASNRLSAIAAGTDGELWAVGGYSTNGPKEGVIIMRLDRSGCGGG